jgi:hypothetical protein
MIISRAIRATFLATTMLVAVGGTGQAADGSTPAPSGTAVARRAIGDFAAAKALADRIAAQSERWAPNDDIEGVLKRTGEFMPRGLVEPPVVSSDDAFSRDPATREVAREKWRQFVDADAAEIARLRQRREEQLALAADLEQRVTHLSESLEKLAEAKRDFWVNITIGKILGQAEKVARKRLPMMKRILENRRRIIRDYDALLERRDAAHAGNVQALHALELVQGVRNERQEPQAAPPERTAPGTGAVNAPTSTRSVVEQRISDRVEARALPAQREAYQARGEATQLKRETDLIVRRTPAPTLGYPVMTEPQPTQSPDFRTEIKVIPPGQR